MKLIILDSNIIRSDFQMKSNNFQLLFDFAEKTNSVIAIPRIVFEELTSQYEKELNFRLSQINKAQNDLGNLVIDKVGLSDFKIDKADQLRKYKDFLNGFLEIPYYDNFLREAVKRQINRVKPASRKGEEFRDTILWLSILAHMSKSNSIDGVFITNNLKDFADESKSDFHEDLRVELEQKNFKLKFYKSLKDFNMENTIEIGFITKDWLNSKIDWEKFESQSEFMVQAIATELFFEYFYRNVSQKETLEYWEIKESNIIKDINEFSVYSWSNNENYRTTVDLIGLVNIDFITSRNKRFSNQVKFYFTIYVANNQTEITEYDYNFHPEEVTIAL
ncbi:MAG: PIN domain-containing protein [Bacteroidota bacterium]